jgi:hypothetical protein
VVKKRATSRKPAGKKKKSAAVKPPRRGDRSRLDLTPLHDHIRARIEKLKKKKKQPVVPVEGMGIAAMGGSDDDTIERLQNALDTLIDICHPTMDIPI